MRGMIVVIVGGHGLFISSFIFRTSSLPSQKLLSLASEKLEKIFQQSPRRKSPSKVQIPREKSPSKVQTPRRKSSTKKQSSRPAAKIEVPSLSAIYQSPYLSAAYRMGRVSLKEKGEKGDGKKRRSSRIGAEVRTVADAAPAPGPLRQRGCLDAVSRLSSVRATIAPPLTCVDAAIATGANATAAISAANPTAAIIPAAAASEPTDRFDPFGLSSSPWADVDVEESGGGTAFSAASSAKRRFLLDHGLPVEEDEESFELTESLKLLRFEIRDHQVRRQLD